MSTTPTTYSSLNSLLALLAKASLHRRSSTVCNCIDQRTTNSISCVVSKHLNSTTHTAATAVSAESLVGKTSPLPSVYFYSPWTSTQFSTAPSISSKLPHTVFINRLLHSVIQSLSIHQTRCNLLHCHLSL